MQPSQAAIATLRADTPTSLPLDNKRRVPPTLPTTVTPASKRVKKEEPKQVVGREEEKVCIAKSIESVQEKTMSSDDGEYFDYEDDGFEDSLDGM